MKMFPVRVLMVTQFYKPPILPTWDGIQSRTLSRFLKLAVKNPVNNSQAKNQGGY